MADADTIFRPQYGIEVTGEWRTLVTETEAGVEVRRQKWQAARAGFRFTSRHGTEGEADAVVDFFDGKKGARTSFTWTCPLDGEVYTVRFASDRLAARRAGYGRWEFDIELRVVA